MPIPAFNTLKNAPNREVSVRGDHSWFVFYLYMLFPILILHKLRHMLSIDSICYSISGLRDCQPVPSFAFLHQPVKSVTEYVGPGLALTIREPVPVAFSGTVTHKTLLLF